MSMPIRSLPLPDISAPATTTSSPTRESTAGSGLTPAPQHTAGGTNKVESGAAAAAPSLPSTTTARLSTANTTAPALAANTLAPGQPLKFNEKLRVASRACWDAIGTTEFNLRQAYGGRRPRAEKDPRHAASLADFKRLRDDRKHFVDVSKTPEYQALRNVEVDDQTQPRFDSPMETLLPPNSKFRQMLDPFTGGIRDPKTGLYAELHERRDGTYQLCFPGTGAGDMLSKHYATDVTQFLGKGKVPKMYRLGAELAQELKGVLPGGSFVVTGHSMGGGVANFAGLCHDVPSYCYNAAALGGACLKHLNDQGLMTPERLGKQTHLRIKGDVVSSDKTQQRLATALFAMGFYIRIPQLVGQVCVIDQTVAGYQKLGGMQRHFISAFDNPYRLKQADVEPATGTAT